MKAGNIFKAQMPVSIPRDIISIRLRKLLANGRT